MNDLVSKTLYPLSLLYGALSSFDRKITTSKKLPKPVISVGNITWGGTGKTQLVIRLASDLQKKGLKTVILSRGYKRKNSSSGNLIVSDYKKVAATAEASGDEPYLIAKAVPGTAVVVGSNRFAAGELAQSKLGCDVFILDDGFQHFELKRDLDIVCVNALDPFGNGNLIPSGILREAPDALCRAGLVVLTNCGLAEDAKLSALDIKIKSLTKKENVWSTYKITGFRKIIERTEKDLEEKLGSKTVYAVSALGKNRGFGKLLEESGFKVSEHYEFRDHHSYSGQDIKKILSLAEKPFPLLTTEKDAVKLENILSGFDKKETARFYAVKIDIEFLKGEEHWKESIKRILRSL
jgi:tetraacyldisaccharide 4'-kinase